MIRGSLLRLGAYGLGTLATVASSAVVIRHLGVVDTGHFLTVIALVTIVATVSDLGLTGIAVRDYSTAPEADRYRLLRNLLGIRIALVVTGLVVAVAFALVVGYPTIMVIGTAVAGLGTILYVIQDGCSIPLQVGLRFGWVAGLQLSIQVGAAITAVLLVLAGAELLPFFAVQLPILVPALIVTTLVGGRATRVSPLIDVTEWRLMIRRVLPYSGAVVLSVIYFQIAQIMVSLLSTPDQTGYFGVAFRILVAFTALPALLVSPALPLLARAGRDDATRFAYASGRLAHTMVLAGCGLALTIFLGARFAIDVVAGPHFTDSVVVLRTLSIALIGTFAIGARGYALLALDRLRAMLVSNAIALAAVLAVGVPLIRAYGAEGAAIAMVVAELTLAACYEYALTLGQPELRLSTGLLVSVPAAALIAGAIASAPALPPVIAAVVGVTLYLGSLFALGVVPAELREALRGRLSRQRLFNQLSGREPQFYGQFAEDRLLGEIFGDRTDGYCVEVGAYDGRTGSASYLFEKKGWHCLLVEPIPALVEEIRRHRACTVINCAASSYNGQATFVVAESVEQMSTLDITTDHLAWIERAGGVTREITVRTATLDSLLDEAGYSEIQFITVDVEGHELAVLEGFTLARFKPRIVILEDNSRGGDPRLRQHMAERGYVHFRQTGVNQWYAHESDKALLHPIELRRFNRRLMRQRWQRRWTRPVSSVAARIRSIGRDDRKAQC